MALYDVLVGTRWQARSRLFAGQDLVATLMRDGQLNGQLTGSSYVSRPQQVNGKWQVIESQLFLDYTYNTHVEFGFTTQINPSQQQVRIQITQGSDSKLLGVDQYANAWEWERIG